jgi:hypothetical protein
VLILAAVVVWAAEASTASGWLVCALAAALLVVGGVVKYAVPGRRLRARGVPSRTLVAGGLLGIVGFFVIPVVGLVIGFVAGMYAAELRRLRDERRARSSTALAVRAVGLSIAIELVGGMVAAAAWLAGVILVSL